MRQGQIIRQVDGMRYLYECPRGTIAIDELDGGRPREITRCLGGRAISSRDFRDALRLHESLLHDAIDSDLDRW